MFLFFIIVTVTIDITKDCFVVLLKVLKSEIQKLMYKKKLKLVGQNFSSHEECDVTQLRQFKQFFFHRVVN